MSAPPSTTSRSTSDVNSPLPPISANGRASRSPVVVTVLISTLMSGCVDRRRVATRSACRSASFDPREAMSILLGSGLIVEPEELSEGRRIDMALLRSRQIADLVDRHVEELRDDPLGRTFDRSPVLGRQGRHPAQQFLDLGTTDLFSSSKQ